MPLSDHEQRVLDEIEKNLYEEDPRFARQVKRTTPTRVGSRRAKLGVAVFIAGFAILLAFFVSGQILIGVLAFGTMVAGIVIFVGSAGALIGASRSQGHDVGERVKSSLKSLEERIRKRYKRI